MISVKFAYHGAPIQTSRHHNASPSVTHNEGVPLELVILVLVANSAPAFLTSQLLTAPNVLGFSKSQHFAPIKLKRLVRMFSMFCGSGGRCSCREKHIFLLQRCRMEAHVPMGTVQSEPLARLQAPVGIECRPSTLLGPMAYLLPRSFLMLSSLAWVLS